MTELIPPSNPVLILFYYYLKMYHIIMLDVGLYEWGELFVNYKVSLYYLLAILSNSNHRYNWVIFFTSLFPGNKCVHVEKTQRNY